MGRLFQKAYPVKNADLYQQYRERYTYCQICGIPDQEAQFYRWPGLSTHHIIKAGRSDELTNLLRLCQFCHDSCHNIINKDIQRNFAWPRFTLGIQLAIKQLRNPEMFCPERLSQLYHKNLPDLEIIPEMVVVEWQRWFSEPETKYPIDSWIKNES